MTDPRPCTHPHARHRHGTREAYFEDDCRCARCRRANAAYQRLRRGLAAAGRTPRGYTDAAPIRAHVEQLRVAGLGRIEIAYRAGIDPTIVYNLLNGRNGRPPTRRVAGTTAERLLAVPLPAPTQLADGALVDGTGTRRRLQALVALGWSQAALARQCGWSKENLGQIMHGYRDRSRVTVRTRALVVALYERLSGRPAPESYGSAQARAAAVRHGWPSPLAWDGVDIDDPKARPDRGWSPRYRIPAAVDVDEVAVERAVHGDRSVHLRPAERAEAVRLLAAQGLSAAEIAARLGVAKRSAQRTRTRVRDEEGAA